MNIRLMGSIALSVALSIMPMSKLANVIMQSPSAPRGRSSPRVPAAKKSAEWTAG